MPESDFNINNLQAIYRVPSDTYYKIHQIKSIHILITHIHTKNEFKSSKKYGNVNVISGISYQLRLSSRFAYQVNHKLP